MSCCLIRLNGRLNFNSFGATSLLVCLVNFSDSSKFFASVSSLLACMKAVPDAFAGSGWQRASEAQHSTKETGAPMNRTARPNPGAMLLRGGEKAEVWWRNEPRL